MIRIGSLVIFRMFVFSIITFSPAVFASWSFKEFKSGYLVHYVARSGVQMERELEIFCTGTDNSMTLSFYLPENIAVPRKSVQASVRVDNLAPHQLMLSVHAMAATTIDTLPEKLLSEVKNGNRVTMKISDKFRLEATFRLNGSGAAIEKLESFCQRISNQTLDPSDRVKAKE